ncbi:MAG: DNA internalization-related competence protein ComEC/Rec2 [Dehalococcoidales bacterium]|nr:DNA internalization-related competence protein ComEC/Rec2 [Dehalococcoidales bacterium]
MLLIYLGGAWIAGIFIGSQFDLPLAFVFFGLVPLPMLLFRRHWKRVLLASLCLFIFFGGAFYFQSSLPADNESSLKFYNDTETVTIKGTVSQDPDVRDKTTRLRLSASEIGLDEGWHEVQGDVLLFVPRYPSYSYGNVLLVTGELETPPAFEGFDYADYLAHEGIYSTMLDPEAGALPGSQGFPPLEWLYSLRNEMSKTLAEVLPEPQASLAQGIVLGIRGNIPPALQDDFSQTGTAHLLAISGLHLSIVTGLMLSAGIWLFGRRYYLYIWLALVVIWLYALITGMHAPVVRSAIMASVFLSAELLGRQRNSITALTFAAAIMVGVNPQVLSTASFQMSFLAMTGLIFIFPPLQNLGRRVVNNRLGRYPALVPTASLISDGFSVTLAAIIAVWPVVAYYFGVVSLVGLLATFLALPALPGIIALGVITGGMGLIALPIAQVGGWLVWLFLSYLLLVVNGFAALPLSHIKVGSTIVPLIWVYYTALALILWFAGNRQRISSFRSKSLAIVKPVMDNTGSFFSRVPRKWLILPLVLIVILVSTTIAVRPDDRLRVSFLNVGQGDAILIQKGSQQILIDGGPSAQATTLELSDKIPFWDRTIELVVLTHPHDDHITGLVEVLNNYRVEQVLSPDIDCDLAIYDEWLRLIEERDIECTTACAGQRIEFDGVVIEVLNPQNPLLSGTESDTDNNGVVLYVSLGEIGFLLTADIMWEGELELITQRAIPRSMVLKVSHHGSATSTTTRFLAVASPRIAVISVGADNNFGHPNSEVMQRFEDELGAEYIYRTDENGTIEFITDGERLWMKTEE